MEEAWLEKYRPITLKDVVGQEFIVQKLLGMISDLKKGKKEIPNLLFLGKPSIGKTTIAHCFLHDALGDDYRDYTMEINASDETGIDTIRDKVKRFISTTSYGCKFNAVLLDEADYLSPNAQACLRRMMEVNSDSMFILCGNYGHKIIEAIKERCFFNGLNLKKLTYNQLNTILERIIKFENIRILDNMLRDYIIKKSYGSVRRMINNLYGAYVGHTNTDNTVIELNTNDIPYNSKEVTILDDLFNIVCNRDKRIKQNNKAIIVSDIVDELVDISSLDVTDIIQTICEIMEEHISEFNNAEIVAFYSYISNIMYKCSQVEYPELMLKCELIAWEK